MEQESITVVNIEHHLVETTSSTANFWDQLSAALQHNFGSKIFEAWLSKLVLVSQNDLEVVLGVNNHFIKNWLEQEYMTDKLIPGDVSGSVVKKLGIKSLVKLLLPEVKTIRLIVDASLAPSIKPAADATSLNATANITNLSDYNPTIAFGNSLNEIYTFDNFVVTDENRLAYSVLKTVAENRCSYTNSPIFIYGNTGCGKTHLAQAVVWHLRQTQPQTRTLFISAEQFMYQFVKAIQARQITNFKDSFQLVDLLIIDDIQFLLDKHKTLDEFFYTFNSLVEQHKQIILLCDQEPEILREIDRKIKSRIDEGIILELKASSRETKQAFLKAMLTKQQIKLAEPLQNYIVEHSEDLRNITGIIKKLTLYRQVYQTELDADTLFTLLGKTRNATTKYIEVNAENIQEKISVYYHITKQELLSACRNKRFVFPRQIAMYLVKKCTHLSLQDIADMFQKKNHATILHAIKVIEDKLAVDLTFQEELLTLERACLEDKL